jgi:hypothetical protein
MAQGAAHGSGVIQMLEFLSPRFQRKVLAPLSERTVVVHGAGGARINVNGGRGAGSWCVRWSDISHYAHAEGHFWNSDAILLALRGGELSMAIPIEACGARDFFEALVRHCPNRALRDLPRLGGPSRSQPATAIVTDSH